MKPEALDAIVSKTMRPEALDAVAHLRDVETSDHDHEDNMREEQSASLKPVPETPTKPSTPFGQRTDGTESAAKAIEEIAQGFKAAMDGALEWAEKKVDKLSEEPDKIGPYASPATCAPTDLDPIASGVLPSMPTQEPVSSEKTGKDDEQQENTKADKENSSRL